MTKRGFGAAVLHDFFVDRLLFCDNLEGLLASVREKGREGGGGIHDVRQQEIRGGNAVNLAHALARLGTRTYLITHSVGWSMPLLTDAFEGLPVELSVKALEPGLTVAFEASREERPFNVMLGDLGGAGSFGPELLDKDDWSSLRDSKIVCAVNWAANAKGTSLVAALREKLPTKTIFVDPADVRDRIPAYGGFLLAIQRRHIVDWLSINEQEAAVTARLLGVPAGNTRSLCRGIAGKLAVKVDIHTEWGSFTSDGGETLSHRTHHLQAKRLTGAGDVWDAASVHFHLRGLDEEARLAASDAAAGLYLKSKLPLGPTEPELASLLEHS